MVDTADLKSSGPKGRAGSSPAPGTERRKIEKKGSARLGSGVRGEPVEDGLPALDLEVDGVEVLGLEGLLDAR